jgi:hypothetical protein
MLHITCDLCGKGIKSGDNHYVVKIEVFPAHDPAELTEADFDEDHMEAISQMLQEMEDTDNSVPVEPVSQHMRYDLCPECRHRYLTNPLHQEPHREAAQKLDFSDN